MTIRAAANGNHVAIHVTDSGPGIPPADIEHLFDDFWQARRNDHRGVGLGLAIASTWWKHYRLHVRQHLISSRSSSD